MIDTYRFAIWLHKRTVPSKITETLEWNQNNFPLQHFTHWNLQLTMGGEVSTRCVVDEASGTSGDTVYN